MTELLSPLQVVDASHQDQEVVFTGSRPFRGRIVRTWIGPRAADEGAAVLRRDQRLLAILPFEAGGDEIAHLVETSALEVRGDCSGPAASPLSTRDRVFRIDADPTPAAYAARVRAALRRIDTGALQKVVLGRCLEVTVRPALAPQDLLDALAAARPGRYLVSTPLTAGRWLVGASPELLIARRGDSIRSTPLAGSMPRSDDAGEDTLRMEQLRASAKDLHEHGFVADAIREALEPLTLDLLVPERPTLLSTDTLHHLATPIHGRLASAKAPSALDLARRLHPTPAVGGTPTAAAVAAIAEIEGRRVAFAGAVGWVDASGDGEFAITIRSAVLAGERIRLFAGAGIVAGSDPASEVRETGAKLRTIARAIGLPEELLP